MMIAK